MAYLPEYGLRGASKEGINKSTVDLFGLYTQDGNRFKSNHRTHLGPQL
jgi:hypothetical protein